jgi:hypothetical protein
MQRAEEVKKRARTKLSEEVPPAVVDRGEQKSWVWSGGSTDGASASKKTGLFCRLSPFRGLGRNRATYRSQPSVGLAVRAMISWEVMRMSSGT